LREWHLRHLLDRVSPGLCETPFPSRRQAHAIDLIGRPRPGTEKLLVTSPSSWLDGDERVGLDPADSAGGILDQGHWTLGHAISPEGGRLLTASHRIWVGKDGCPRGREEYRGRRFAIVQRPKVVFAALAQRTCEENAEHGSAFPAKYSGCRTTLDHHSIGLFGMGGIRGRYLYPSIRLIYVAVSVSVTHRVRRGIGSGRRASLLPSIIKALPSLPAIDLWAVQRRPVKMVVFLYICH
jgi:hypothetical protein